MEDEYRAYCIDQAVGYFGRTLEAELDKVEGKTDREIEQKRKRLMDRYLLDENEKPPPGRFADPRAMK